MPNAPTPQEVFSPNTVLDLTDPANHKIVIPLADYESRLAGVSTATETDDIWDKIYTLIALSPIFNNSIGDNETDFPELSFFLRFQRLSNDLSRNVNENQRVDVFELLVYSSLGLPNFNNLV